jgi:TorA maturation chaperone TorD
MSNFDALMHQASQRARGYWLLSRLFLEVPTPVMLTELARILMSGEGEFESPALNELRAVVDEAAVSDEAAIAFTRHLSLGDRKAGEPLPFEAHVREGCLPGECTRQVAAAMQTAGFDDLACGAASPDHLGAELRFMALLCFREREAWTARDRDAAGSLLRQQREFLAAHLLSWAPEYCLNLAERAANAYLRVVARLAASTIEDDVAVLEDICCWIIPDDLQAGDGQRGVTEVVQPSHGTHGKERAA